MPEIHVLDQDTINQIAAGEVIERPASVVKELLENAIDAKATAVTVEIRDGGLSVIRITDNGCGIEPEQIPTAFLSHATSKIRDAADLVTIASLGFRGEALSSIAAVAKVELITRTPGSISGSRYRIEGGKEVGLEEVGAPEGTTFLVRDLFFNTPARRKFLKTPATEASHVAGLVEKIALSHPEISFRFIQNNQTKLFTSGNGNLKDIIYAVYGREIAQNLVPVAGGADPITVGGFIGKPVIARSNRSFEVYFINGRYIRNGLIGKAVEDAYKPFMMQHKYPFTMLSFTVDPSFIDVNVHPSKLELRFRNDETVYRTVYHTISVLLSGQELIPEVDLEKESDRKAQEPAPDRAGAPAAPAGLRAVRFRDAFPAPAAPMPAVKPAGQVHIAADTAEDAKTAVKPAASAEPAMPAAVSTESTAPADKAVETAERENAAQADTARAELAAAPASRPDDVNLKPVPSPASVTPSRISEQRLPYVTDKKPEQMTMFTEKLLTPEARKHHRIIGQLFSTYWLVEFGENLYIIDQHAAHEKVLYERTIKSLRDRSYTSQMLNPPAVVTLTEEEQLMLQKYGEEFQHLGFEAEPFGGNDFALRAVPDNLFSVDKGELFLEILDSLTAESGMVTGETLNHRIATMSCKAAVKGNNRLSVKEAEELIDELLTLDNPYACPHGRPTIISMSRTELEKKFKRIV
ncbi:MAG TPA: DNA mismatch repair endonuclease MutL [Lachnoclostridium sp.]|nr:DNA mismatch repair endonuclease MutL [Lachnoclostridium sp.]